MKSLLLTIIATLALGAATAAKSTDEDRALKECRDDAGQSLTNVCVASETHAVDRELDAIYQELLTIEPHEKELRAAQSAWTQYRDATCNYEIRYLDDVSPIGSLYSYEYGLCKQRLARLRILELKRSLEMTKELIK